MNTDLICLWFGRIELSLVLAALIAGGVAAAWGRWLDRDQRRIEEAARREFLRQAFTDEAVIEAHFALWETE